MEVIDVLKIQNRFLDTQEQTKSIIELKKFNEELISEIEFKNNNPILFSEEITKLFVKYNFYYRGQTHGKSWSSYYNDEYSCFFRYDNDKIGWDNHSILFCYNSNQIKINSKEDITEDFLKSLLVIAKNAKNSNNG